MEDIEKKTIMTVDMSCPSEANKEDKRTEKIRKCQQLFSNYENEGKSIATMKVISTVSLFRWRNENTERRYK